MRDLHPDPNRLVLVPNWLSQTGAQITFLSSRSFIICHMENTDWFLLPSHNLGILKLSKPASNGSPSNAKVSENKSVILGCISDENNILSRTHTHTHTHTQHTHTHTHTHNKRILLIPKIVLVFVSTSSRNLQSNTSNVVILSACHFIVLKRVQRYHYKTLETKEFCKKYSFKIKSRR